MFKNQGPIGTKGVLHIFHMNQYFEYQVDK